MTCRKPANLHPILDPSRGRHHRQIELWEIPQARAEGCRLHHEVEEQVYDIYDEDEDGNAVYEEDRIVTRDAWFAATPEWVADYHDAGGMWGYDD